MRNKNQALDDLYRQVDWKKPIAVLVTGVAVTIGLTFLLHRDVKIQSAKEFALNCNEIKTKIEGRLNSHAILLSYCASFFASSDTVTREDWRIFIGNSKLDHYLPGIEGVGYSHIVPKNQLESHIRRIRNEGFPEYTIKPSGEREIYTSIVFLEPFSGRNLRAFGFDMYSEPVRRKAMSQACDDDVAALSGKVTLVQESDQDVQSGTLMYLPIYRKGMPVSSVEERRKAIIGWVYSPYRMNDLLNGILGRWGSGEAGGMQLQIFDDGDTSPEALLFDSQLTDQSSDAANNMRYSLPLDFNGKKWTLCFSQSEKELEYYNDNVLIVFVSGLLISILLFALVQSLSKATNRLKVSEQLSLQLKESEEKYRVLVENANEAIFVVHHNKIVFANTACEQVSGIAGHELNGMQLCDVFQTEDPEKLIQQQTDLISGKIKFFSGEIALKGDHKENRWLLLSSVPIIWNSLPCTLNMAAEITERKRAEETIIQKNKELQNLNATKDKFFSIIAHDLRGPFSAFLGSTELMAEELTSLSFDDIKQLSRSMQKSASTLYRLLENLLQWSQIQQGTIPFNPQQIQLVSVVKEGVEIIQEQATHKMIELTMDIPGDLQVSVDKNMIETVIRNLLSNAIKYTAREGRVSVSAKPTSRFFIEVSVADSGIGMNQKLLENLFRTDIKTNRVGTDNEPSSGLGLLLCKEFVEKHGGTIWAESIVNQGTTFHFTIPAC